MKKKTNCTILVRGLSKSERNKLKKIAEDKRISVNTLMLYAISNIFLKDSVEKSTS